MLPPDATARSYELLPIAQYVVAQCPPDLFDEVVLTGSVSRGQADALSDIEVIFMVDELKAREVYVQWMESLDGYQSTIPTRSRENNLYVLECYINGIEFGMMWLPWDTLDAQISAVMETPLRADLVMPWVVNHSLPFADAPRFQQFKQRCAVYPDHVRTTIIEGMLAGWRMMLPVPHIVNAVNAAYRGSLYDLRRRQFYGIDTMLNVLFAYNRHWLVDLKWLGSAIDELQFVPPNFFERLNALMCAPDADSNIRQNAGLIHDTLQTIAPEFDVEDIASAFATYRDAGLSYWLDEQS